MSLIQEAYVFYGNGHMNLGLFIPIVGAPAWLDSDLYEVDAKAEGPHLQGAMHGPMLQALLENRLKLKVHRETREGPVYVLTLAKGGHKLQPSKEGSCIPDDPDHPPPVLEKGLPNLCGMFRSTKAGMDVHDETMAAFCMFFSGYLDRNIIDKTGLTGTFDIHLDLSHADLVPPEQPGPPDPSLAFSAVKTAMRKLGLRLDPAKGPREILVIDHVEKPTAN